MATKKNNKTDVKVGVDKKGVKVKTKSNGKTKTKTIKFNSKLFWIIVAVVLIVAIAVMVFKFAFPEQWDALFKKKVVAGNPEGDLAVHFVDVGQGDCIIIQLPDGKNMIIDAGGDNDNVTKEDCEDRIIDNIDELGIKVFDYMMLTHSDSDHVDYLDSVLEKYVVNNIYRPAFNSRTEVANGVNPQYALVKTDTYESFITAVNKEIGADGKPANVFLNIGEKNIVGEGYTIDMYGCPEDWYLKEAIGEEPDAKQKNRVSPYTMLSYNSEKGVRSVMFTGDGEGENEGKTKNWADKYFLDTYYKSSMNIDVLKVGHHGSAVSSSEDFLNKLDPEYAIISAGVLSKQHGHPRQECLNRLSDYQNTFSDPNGDKITTYMTKQCGDIVLRVNKAGVISFDMDVKEGQTANVGVISSANTKIINIAEAWNKTTWDALYCTKTMSLVA